jgi:hypothetical protein
VFLGEILHLTVPGKGRVPTKTVQEHQRRTLTAYPVVHHRISEIERSLFQAGFPESSSNETPADGVDGETIEEAAEEGEVQLGLLGNLGEGMGAQITPEWGAKLV